MTTSGDFRSPDLADYISDLTNDPADTASADTASVGRPAPPPPQPAARPSTPPAGTPSGALGWVLGIALVAAVAIAISMAVQIESDPDRRDQVVLPDECGLFEPCCEEPALAADARNGADSQTERIPSQDCGPSCPAPASDGIGLFDAEDEFTDRWPDCPNPAD